MIIVRISGGLGNQMYQYALFLSLKKVYPETEIKLDLNDYNRHFAHTGYILDKVFGIQEPIASKAECNRLSSMCWYYPGFGAENLSFQPIRNIYRKIYIRWHLAANKKNEKAMIYGYKPYIFNPGVFYLDSRQDWYLKGYWQNLHYFDTNKEQLQQVFKFRPRLDSSDEKIIAEMKSTNSVSVHVRKGDYVGSGFDLCGDEYYQQAIRMMNNKVKNALFFFFSDDPSYVHAHFGKLENVRIISSRSEDYEKDLFLMGVCKHHIIPNSSFSFWPAYLSEQKDSITICPRFSREYAHTLYPADYPSDWIVLENVLA